MAKKKTTGKSSKAKTDRAIGKSAENSGKKRPVKKKVKDDFSEKLRVAQATLDAHLKLHGHGQPQVAELYLTIGDLWNEKRSYVKAIEAYQNVLELRLKALAPDFAEGVIPLSEEWYYLPEPMAITIGYDDDCYIAQNVSGVIPDDVLQEAIDEGESWSSFIYERDWYEYDDIFHTYGMSTPATEIQFGEQPPQSLVLNYEAPEFDSVLVAFARSSKGDFVHVASSEEKSSGWRDSIKHKIQLGPGFFSTENIGVDFEDGMVDGYFCMTTEGEQNLSNCHSHSSTTKGTEHSLYFNNGIELIPVDTPDAPGGDVDKWRKALLKSAGKAKKGTSTAEISDEPDAIRRIPSVVFLPHQASPLPKRVIAAPTPVIYKEVKIGSQIWMSENLNVDRFANGDPIPQARSSKEWEFAHENKKPVWCYYDFDPANGGKYGKLYNGHAVKDHRGLAPSGWHIPSEDDWTTLTDSLGGAGHAAMKMKSDQGWRNAKTGTGNGNNESGFSALPAGGWSYGFSSVGSSAQWWSSTEKGSEDMWAWEITSFSGTSEESWFGSYFEGSTQIKLTSKSWMPGRPIYRTEVSMSQGLSVRCIKEALPETKAETENFKTTPFLEFKIGSQVWMAGNLDVDHFSNGDPIPQVRSAREWKSWDRRRKPAWCYYGSNPALGKSYGKLYNWYAVSDPRGLCPPGWHVPSDEEWRALTDYLGGEEVAGFKMKSMDGWMDEEGKPGNGNNESGFLAKPGGMRNSYGTFYHIGSQGAWWSSSEGESSSYAPGTLAFVSKVTCGGNAVHRKLEDKESAYSVRCIKDSMSKEGS